MKLHRVTIQDVIGDLPDIEKVDFKKFQDFSFDLFIQAVGFEERTVGMIRNLSNVKGFKVNEAILINYDTNISENQFYDKELNDCLKNIANTITSFPINLSFDEAIRQKLDAVFALKSRSKVIIDLSTMSSRLILSFIRTLFQHDIELVVLYAEGTLYHPTESEFEELLNKDDLVERSQTYGIDKVSISPDYNGGSKEYQDLVICFPSFTADRTHSIVTTIDDLILKQKDKERLIWIIGSPHMEDPVKKKNRSDMQIKINNVSAEAKIYHVCTFDYKKTLEVLDHIYKDTYSRYHINISDLGSKMQSMGIALFSTLRRDVTVYYSEPISYNSSFYSEGIKDYWMIDVGKTKDYMEELFKVDTIEAK